MTGSAIAVVDCGTNSTRLLVQQTAQSLEGRPQDLLRTERITGLGRGFAGPGTELQADSIQRVLTALAEFAELIEAHDVSRIRAVATSAAREAANSQEFLAQASSSLGAPVELLSEQDEATYGFSGATAGWFPTASNSATAGSNTVLVVDIGGGSTEFSLGQLQLAGGEQSQLQGWRSLPLGSVRLTERYLRSDPPKPEELSATISVIRQYLDDIDREMPEVRSAQHLIGVAGTVTTMAAVELGLMEFDSEAINDFVLTKTAAEDVFRTLATESLAARKQNPGLHPERAQAIVGGCCIVVAVLRHWEFERCYVRCSDLLDGLAAELSR